jgi:hypothetical protein
MLFAPTGRLKHAIHDYTPLPSSSPMLFAPELRLCLAVHWRCSSPCYCQQRSARGEGSAVEGGAERRRRRGLAI